MIPIHQVDAANKRDRVLRRSARIAQRNHQKEDKSYSSDDSDDDYIGTPEPNLSQIDKQHRPQKQRKRPVFGEIINKDRLKRRRAIVTAVSTAHASQEVKPVSLAAVHESKPIPIQGTLTLQACGQDVFYCVNFSQLPATQLPWTLTPIGNQSLKRARFSLKEDNQLVTLKKTKNLTWDDIAQHFPGRSKGSLQVRHSKLKGVRQRPRREQKPREVNNI